MENVVQEPSFWHLVGELVRSPDFHFFLGYFGIGIVIAAVFTFFMVKTDSYDSREDPVMWNSLIVVGWPVFLFLCVFLGIPHLIYVCIKNGIKA